MSVYPTALLNLSDQKLKPKSGYQFPGSLRYLSSFSASAGFAIVFE
jgi:hypothetical protein